MGKSMSKFKAGDLVQLKAGGPVMVVEQVDMPGEECECSWFAGAKDNTRWFKQVALVPAEEKK
jgi:uncharacterized protein YodC (DUF2158 family)